MSFSFKLFFCLSLWQYIRLHPGNAYREIAFYEVLPAKADAQRCGDFLPPPEPQTYTMPTSEGGTTASAFLEEYRPGRDKSINGCTILLKAGTVFEIDVPFCLEKVTIITEIGSGIRILSGQGLALYSCTLEPFDANAYWKGLTHENESSKIEMYNCRISNIASNEMACLNEKGQTSIQVLKEKLELSKQLQH